MLGMGFKSSVLLSVGFASVVSAYTQAPGFSGAPPPVITPFPGTAVADSCQGSCGDCQVPLTVVTGTTRISEVVTTDAPYKKPDGFAEASLIGANQISPATVTLTWQNERQTTLPIPCATGTPPGVWTITSEIISHSGVTVTVSRVTSIPPNQIHTITKTVTKTDGSVVTVTETETETETSTIPTTTTKTIVTTTTKPPITITSEVTETETETETETSTVPTTTTKVVTTTKPPITTTTEVTTTDTVTDTLTEETTSTKTVTTTTTKKPVTTTKEVTITETDTETQTEETTSTKTITKTKPPVTTTKTVETTTTETETETTETTSTKTATVTTTKTIPPITSTTETTTTVTTTESPSTITNIVTSTLTAACTPVTITKSESVHVTITAQPDIATYCPPPPPLPTGAALTPLPKATIAGNVLVPPQVFEATPSYKTSVKVTAEFARIAVVDSGRLGDGGEYELYINGELQAISPAVSAANTHICADDDGAAQCEAWGASVAEYWIGKDTWDIEIRDKKYGQPGGLDVHGRGYYYVVEA